MLYVTWFATGFIIAGFISKFVNNKEPQWAYSRYDWYIINIILYVIFGPIAIITVAGIYLHFGDVMFWKYGWGFYSRATARKIEDDARKNKSM